MVEDFDTWTEVDALNRLTRTSTRSSFTGMTRSDDSIYLYKDYGADHFTDFIHEFAFRITAIQLATSAVERALLICYVNTLADWKDNRDAANHQLGLLLWGVSSSTRRLQLDESYAGSDYISTNYCNISLNTTYYARITKIGTSAVCQIFNDAARTSLRATLSLTLNADDSFQYILCPQSMGLLATYYATGYIENLTLIYNASNDLQAGFKISSLINSADLHARFLIPRGFQNLQAVFQVRPERYQDLLGHFIVGQGIEDLQCETIIRHTDTYDIPSKLIIEKASSSNLQCGFKVQHYSDLWARFNVHKTYDFSGALGIGFYWWGSEVIEGDQIVDFQLLTPTGGWIAKFPDGDAEWRWILLPFADRDPTSNQRLIEVDLGGSHANKAEVESFLWTYYSKGIRRVAYVIIWYGGDLQAGFKVRHPDSAVLQCALKVQHASSAPLQCGLNVRNSASSPLLAALNVNP